MGQRLREVAQERRRRRIDLLGVQTDVVFERDQLVQQIDRLRASAGEAKDLGEPERAAEEGALLAAEVVVPQVPVEERPAAELPPERIDRPREAGARGIAVAELRTKEDTRVEVLAIGGLGIALLRFRPASLLDERPDRAGFRTPLIGAPRWDLARRREPAGAVERHPAHHLRLSEMPLRPSDLPDACVRPRPDPT